MKTLRDETTPTGHNFAALPDKYADYRIVPRGRLEVRVLLSGRHERYNVYVGGVGVGTDHTGGDHRSGQRPAPGFIGSGNNFETLAEQLPFK